MKKKLFVILMSLALVVTMMPMSVFAGEENASSEAGNEVTPIGETGLSLTGSRAATSDDYRIEVVGNQTYVLLYTPGWMISGDAPDVRVDLFCEGDLEFGDIEIQAFQGISEKSYNKFTISGNVIVHEEFAFGATNVEISGNGSLTLLDGCLSSVYFITTNLSLNVANVVINLEQQDWSMGMAIFAHKVNILGGNVIVHNTSNFEGGLNIGIISGMDDLFISDNANVFASGTDAAVVGSSAASFDLSKCSGHSENLPYEQASEVYHKTEVVDFPSGVFSNTKTLAVDGSNAIAKTFVNEAPIENVFNVTFKYQDGATSDLTVDVPEGRVVGEPCVPARDGYTFEGWYDNPEGQGNPYNFSSEVHNDFTLYAKWVKNVEPGPTPGPNPPTPPVNPTNSSTSNGVNTGDNAMMPILLIVFGFAATVSAVTLARRVRNR